MGVYSNAPEIDNKYRAEVEIDLSHHMIHDGKHFFVVDFDADLDDTQTKKWLITAPNTTTRLHFVVEITTSLGATIIAYENPTASGGTGLTVLNSDRNSSNAAEGTATKDPTTSGGTLLLYEPVGASGGSTKIGGKAATRDEIILKQNEDYSFEVTSKADNNVIGFRAMWYEI